MGAFRLDSEPPPGATVAGAAGADGLTKVVLLHNARWFTRIRWIVVVVLAAFGGAGRLFDAGAFQHFGILPPGGWPFFLAGILALLNLGSMHWVRRLAERATCTWRSAAANIWFQIVTDLAVLTVLVYRIGPTHTVIPFAYLFHITLACIFFGRRDSLLVTLLSALLFLATVTLEWLDPLARAGIPAGTSLNAPDLVTALLVALQTVFVWMVVWYLASSLSGAVRTRDRNLAAANERIVRADEAINRQMLRVTHDLKAPFSGIESNIQILKRMYWNEATDNVRRIIEKIEARSASLRARIGAILTLGSLRSNPGGECAETAVNLRELLQATLQDVHGLASEKRIAIEFAEGDANVSSDVRQLKMLFLNLISNAIVYSRENGTVSIAIRAKAAQVSVRVEDRGMGISAAALPHIFDDFYRAPEAAMVNPNSTGLGLAIIRQVARNLRLSIVVESEPGKGTVFQVLFPSTLNDGNRRRTHGTHHDN